MSFSNARLFVSPDEPTTLGGSTSSTVESADPNTGGDQLRHLMVTILLHPEGRAGETASLGELSPGTPREISRNRPVFFGVDGPRPLDHPRVSRRPIWVVLRDGELLVRTGAEPVRAAVDGEPLVSTHRVPLQRLGVSGALLELNGCVLLWLHWTPPAAPNTETFGILGVSPPSRSIRADVRRAARSPAPVLIRGESGVGKELVARAIHRASPRAGSPWVAVNMAAIPVSMAAAELFGHGRGAFTGAVQTRRGWFEQANHGTLFLDEIGETPADVQPQLLRALDEGEIQPVGQPTRRVDVRLLSATDADLDALVQTRRFRAALFHRVTGTVISVPPLRARRVDIPILLQHFLAEDLRRFGATDLLTLSAQTDSPWLRSDLVTRLMAWPFPGNVRELRNLSLDIAAGSHDAAFATLPEAVRVRMGRSPEERDRSSQERSGPPRGGGSQGAWLHEAQVRQALHDNDWVLTRAAAALGVARNTLIEAMARMPDLHQARDLDAHTIQDALDASDGSVETAARRLRVSAHGLRLRCNALGLDPRR